MEAADAHDAGETRAVMEGLAQRMLMMLGARGRR